MELATDAAHERGSLMFLVTKAFTHGILAGLTISDQSPVAFVVGQTYRGIGGSAYVVTACVPVTPPVPPMACRERSCPS